MNVGEIACERRDITTYVTTAALEETLHCQDRSAAFSPLRQRFPEVGEFLQSP